VAFGLKPSGYHLTSLVFHALNTVVLFVLTVTLVARCMKCKRPWLLTLGAGLAVALYAVHPLRTEVVAWVSCQPYLPCTLFLMLAVLAYLRAFPEGRPPRRGWLIGTFFLFLAALLSKAVAVSLPVVLVILDVYPLKRLGGGAGRWFGPEVRRVWWEKEPFVALSVCFMVLAIAARVEAQHIASVQRSGPFARVAQSSYGIWFYLVRTVLPVDLMAYYPLPSREQLVTFPFLMAILAALGVSVALFLLRGKWPALLAVWLSYLVILAPNLDLLRIGSQIVADRYSYAPLIGLVALLAAAVCRFLDTRRQVAEPAAASIAIGLVTVIVLIVMTRAQCSTWRTSETLFHQVLSHGGSQSALAHNNLGKYLYESGRIGEAKGRFEATLRIDPQWADAHYNLGCVLIDLGRVEEARRQFEEVLRIDPSYAAAHSNLGTILAREGRKPEARDQFERALRINPSGVDAYNGLASLLIGEGRFGEARALTDRALRLKPESVVAHNNLGVILKDLGHLDQARAEFDVALRLKANDSDAHCNLGLLLLRLGQTNEATAQIREALRLNPRLVEAHNGLGFLFKNQGRLNEARAQFEEAARLNPRSVEAQANLGSILLSQGEIDRATFHLDEAMRLNLGDASVYRSVAMAWISAPEARHRDGQRAVAAATRACELTGWRNAAYIDTCAAAYDVAGNLEEAARCRARAIALSPEPNARGDTKVFTSSQSPK
jgi:tetratricopeptide (TPR) repeat protein